MKERKQLNIQIGERIQQARRMAGFTQEQLSEAIDVTPQYLSDLERGVVGTSIPTLMNICSELHVTSDYLLFGKTDTNDISMIIERVRHLPEEHIRIIERSVNLMLEALQTDIPPYGE